MPDPFITTEDLSEYLGRDVDAEPAADLAVEFGCDTCRDYAEQSFNAETSTITLDGTGTDALFLPEVPVNSAGTVDVLGTDGTFSGAGSFDYSLNGDGVLYATNAGGTSLFGCIWPRGRQNVRVTYDHGYASGEMPASVKGVALAAAARFLIQGPAASETVGEVNVRYSGESTALMPTERIILDKHRRHHNGS